MKVNLTNDDIRENYVYNLLKAYGIEDVGDYLHPNDDALQSPENFENIQKGYELYKDVCDRNGKILLIVDCDVDGYTSAAIFHNYTKLLYPQIQIDYRLHEGKAHGLEDHIDWIEANPLYDLVVCPDSSSNDFELHERLKIFGIPVLVLDHHLTDIKISENAVVINNQLSPNYTNKELTGAGVVYQFCRYLDIQYGVDYAENFVDLAALGIDGDMGSLLDIENRYLMLKGFNHITNFFFNVLLDKQSYSMGGKITPISVAFYIVPLMNAMVRVGTMAEKDRMFRALIDGKQMVPSGKRGEKGMDTMVAIESARECGNAKSHQTKDMDAAVEQLEQKILDNCLLDNKILFVRLDEEDFPSELNGLIAMKLAAKYKKPTLIGRLNNEGYDRGSIRGLQQSELNDLKQFLTDSGMFEYVQGHANAAGFSIEDRLVEEFHTYANEKLKDVDFNESCYDAQFMREASDNDIADIIHDVANHPDVWGTNVPEPMIYIRNIHVNPNQIQIMGKNQDTVKVNSGDMVYIKFHAKDMIEELGKINEPFTMEVIGRGNLNEWAGIITEQIMIENYSIKTEAQSLLEF